MGVIVKEGRYNSIDYSTKDVSANSANGGGGVMSITY